MQQNWWKESIVYQIYPRSFQDSNGDGIGDIPGIIQRLDYLENLGIDVIWLSPIYQSPNDDNGYDISDYYNIMPEFGTMDDFNHMLDEIHRRDMKLVMDLVVNHTSDEHQWFQEARKSKDNPYRDYYIWREGRENEPPNNWVSFFGGSAWEKDEESGEYYLHLFTRKQPDLNWENPTVRESIYSMMRFWLDKGIDGFRMDVIPLISKRQDFPDGNLSDFKTLVEETYANGPKVHDYLQEMHREVLSLYDIMTIGEGIGVKTEQANLYVGNDRQELNMLFHFGHMGIDQGPKGKFDPVPWDLPTLKKIFFDWYKACHEIGWTCLYLGNHDFPRMVSRFGQDSNYHEPAAKLLATLLFSLRGTPFIFQGDEIGMTNTQFENIDDFRDVETLNSYREVAHDAQLAEQFLKGARKMGRDNARTPMQWDDTAQAGFTNGEPWLKVNPNYPQINAKQQEQATGSIFKYYRRLIKLRKNYPAFVYGYFEPTDMQNKDLFTYYRKWDWQQVWVVLNFSSKGRTINMPQDIEWCKCLISNYHAPLNMNGVRKIKLEPWEARIYEF